MKHYLRRCFSLLLGAVMVFCLLPRPTGASAAGVTTEAEMIARFAELQQDYRHGEYWNWYNPEVGTDYNGTSPAGTGPVACPDSFCNASGYCRGDLPGGCPCRCGTFNGWAQCAGYAWKMYWLTWGTTSYETHYNLDNVCAGDMIRHGGHTIFVTKVVDETIYYTDCNNGGVFKGTCRVQWNGSITKETITARGLEFIAHCSSNSGWDGVYEQITYGYCGSGQTGQKSVKWILGSEGTLKFTGTGRMKDYTSRSTPWGHFEENIKTVIIDDGVKNIGSGAFRHLDGLTDVVIGNTVTEIGDSAFQSCQSLTSVTIGSSVTTIGSYAFRYCTGLTSVTIPDSVTTIGEDAFYSCDSLTSVAIGSGVTTIGETAFFSCDKLTSLYLKDLSAWCNADVGAYGAHPFSKISGTKNLYVNGVLVTELVIPDGVTTIGECAFLLCNSLTSVTIPDSVTSIGDSAFSFCENLTSLAIPDSVTTIGNAAFEECTGLTSVTIGNGVTTIGNHAFSYCESLTSLTIGNRVTSVGYDAFWGCDSLSSVTVPDSVTNIGKGAFTNCKRLTDILVAEKNPQYKDLNGVLYNKSCTEVHSFPTGRAGAYIIPDSVTTIGDDAFYNCDSLTSVAIGSGVTTIGKYAFYSCTGLTSVTIPDSVTTIGDDAFSSCKNLTSVTIGDSVTTIGDDAFSSCKNLTSVTIGDSVTTIGDDAFSSCKNLTSVTIGDSVTTIGEYAFGNCDSLTSVTIPDSVTTIADGAFEYCDSLASVTIGDSVTSIGEEAFYDCGNLLSVYFRGNAPTLGDDVFEDTPTTLYYIPGTSGWTDSSVYNASAGTWNGIRLDVWRIDRPPVTAVKVADEKALELNLAPGTGGFVKLAVGAYDSERGTLIAAAMGDYDPGKDTVTVTFTRVLPKTCRVKVFLMDQDFTPQYVVSEILVSK